jgi:hypothetical protein
MSTQAITMLLAGVIAASSTPSRAPSMAFHQSGSFDISAVIAPERSDLVLHEPLDVVLTIHNAGPEAAVIDLGADRKSGITVKMQLPDGTEKVGRIPVHGDVSRIGRITLKPGQSYSQDLIINEWTEFGVPGLYRIAVLFDNPIIMPDGTTSKLGPINIVANVGPQNDEILRRFCDDTLRKLLTADSSEAALNAAGALSYVQDPVAVPYLRQAFGNPHRVHSSLVSGLERIGTHDAIEVLLEMVAKEPWSESGFLRFTLERMATKTRDPNLQSRIRMALQDN